MFAAITVLAAVPQVLAFAHKTNDSGAVLQWRQPEIPFLLNTDGRHGLAASAIEDAVVRSIREFQLDESNLIFTLEGDTNTRRVEYADGENVIFFEDEWERIGADETLLALSFVFSQDDGEILAADIAFNAQHHQWDTDGGNATENSNDFYNALTHELGHVSGLAHSEFEEASMAPSTSAGETRKRTLHEDDIAGLAELYGQPLMTPAAGCSTLGALPVVPATASAFLGLVVGLRRRR